jgi:hypothetical protein
MGGGDCHDKRSSSILAEYHMVNADWPDYCILKTDVAVKVGIV